jgi:hypothetical protein
MEERQMPEVAARMPMASPMKMTVGEAQKTDNVLHVQGLCFVDGIILLLCSTCEENPTRRAMFTSDVQPRAILNEVDSRLY